MCLHVHECFVIRRVDFIVISFKPLQIQLVSFLCIEFIQSLPDMLVITLPQKAFVVASFQLHSYEFIFLCRQQDYSWTCLNLVFLKVVTLIQKLVLVFFLIYTRQILTRASHGRDKLCALVPCSRRARRILTTKEISFIHTGLLRYFYMGLRNKRQVFVGLIYFSWHID